MFELYATGEYGFQKRFGLCYPCVVFLDGNVVGFVRPRFAVNRQPRISFNDDLTLVFSVFDDPVAVRRICQRITDSVNNGRFAGAFFACDLNAFRADLLLRNSKQRLDFDS